MPNGPNGSLHYLRQTHPLNRWYPPNYFESQLNILNALLVLRPRNVFVEGFSKDFRPKKADFTYVKNVNKCFGKYKRGTKFEEIKLEDLTSAHRDIFKRRPSGGAPGAAIIYACLFQDVTVRATQSKLTEWKVSRILANSNSDREIEKKDDFVMRGREEEAVEFINKFFRKNPGNVDENSALVFGHEHDFSKYSRRMRGLRFHNHAEIIMRKRLVGDHVSIAGTSQKRLDPYDNEQVNIWKKAGKGYKPAHVRPITGSVTYVDQSGHKKFRDFGEKIQVLDIKDTETMKAILGVVEYRLAGEQLDFGRLRGSEEFLRKVTDAAAEMRMVITNVPPKYKQAKENGTSKLRSYSVAVKRPDSARDPRDTLRPGRVVPSPGRNAPTHARYGRT